MEGGEKSVSLMGPTLPHLAVMTTMSPVSVSAQGNDMNNLFSN